MAVKLRIFEISQILIALREMTFTTVEPNEGIQFFELQDELLSHISKYESYEKKIRGDKKTFSKAWGDSDFRDKITKYQNKRVKIEKTLDWTREKVIENSPGVKNKVIEWAFKVLCIPKEQKKKNVSKSPK